MKTKLFVTLAATILSTVALAQPPGGGGPGGPGGPGRQGGGGMRRFEQLGLTEAQKTKMKALTEKQREESNALRKKHTEQINAILTPEQRKKLDEMRKEMMERFRTMGGAAGRPGGPGAPTGAGKPGTKKG